MIEHDRAALEAAMVAARAESPGRSQQLDMKLVNGEPWVEVAEFAASCAQTLALHLKPSQAAPANTNDEIDPVEGDFYGNRPDEVALLKRMLAAGISRYEPDPMKALAEVETQSA